MSWSSESNNHTEHTLGYGFVTTTFSEKFSNCQLVILPLWNLIFFVNFDGDAWASWRHHLNATGGHFEMGKQTITRQYLVNLE